MKIDGKEIIFLRTNGEVARNPVGERGSGEKTGEIIYFELLGFDHSMNDKKDFILNGKKVYKRLVIQRVYPCIKCETPSL